MLAFLTRIIGVVIGLFLLAFPALGAEIKPDNYDIYIGDMNGDGGSDYYFHQKPLLLILHGDIATPIFAKQPNSFVVYRNGTDYSAPALLTLTETDLAQRLVSGVLRPALISIDFHIWRNGTNSYVFLRGADSSAPALLLTSTANDALPIYSRNYPVTSYPDISNPNVPLRIQDINNDGFQDVILGAYSADSGEVAYLADSNGMPSTYIEVTASNTLPSVLLNTDEGISYHVGTVAGEFRVDESGGANYTIPFQLPQGTAGVTPQVSLNYSSGAGIGILGKGWSLNAFSSISRCRQTLSQDGVAKPITWTAEDRFCLDGQRLILVAGTYGAAGSTYKTEMDSFVTITAIGTVSDGSGYFKSVAKDGSVTFFGRTNNSKFYNSVGGISTTLTWAQSRFQDNVGNGIDYVYEGDSATGQRLKKIYYAYSSVDKNPASVPQTGVAQAVVTFNYENRLDISSSYVAGHEFKQATRLYQVTVQNNGSELRRYNLSYMSSSTAETRYDNKISRLERIRECNGPSNCFMPTTFMWGGGSHVDLSQAGNSVTFENASSGKYVLNHFFADLTGNGKQDLVYLMFESGTATSATLAVRVKYADTALSSTIYFYNKNYNNFRIASLDYNADGRQDLAIYDNANWKIYLSTPRSDNKWKIDASSTLIDPGLTEINTSFIDIDSDGLADAANGTTYRLLARNTEPVTSNKAYSFGASRAFSWGASTNYPVSSESPAGSYSCFDIEYKTRLNPTKVADFNGDGVVDFIGEYIKTGMCNVPATEPQYQEKAETYALVVSGNNVSNYSGAKITGSAITPVDINGDGLSDITYRSGNNIYHMVNNGAGFNAAALWITLPTYSSGPAAVPQFLDFNGDGAVDVLWNNRNNGKLYVRLWGGSTDIIVRENTSYGSNDSHLVMDISGDGILDYLKITTTSLIGYKGTLATVGEPIPCTYTSTPGGMQCVGGVPNPSIPVPGNEQHTNVYSIDNGLGNVTKITYGTLSNSERYQTTELNLTVTNETLPTGCPQNMGYPCAPTYTVTTTDPGDFYSRLNGGWILPTGSVTLVPGNANKGAPVLEVNGAMPVVMTVESTAPSAGATPNNINADGMSKIDYYYSEAKMQASGRGFLGFNTLKTVDAQTGITTVTTYRQDFPFIGSPLATVVYKSNSADAVILSKSINTWDFTQGTGVGNTKYFQTKLKKAEEFSYDFTGGAQLQSVTTENGYDAYGNLTSSKVVTTGKKANGVATTLTKETSNVYGSSVQYQQFGRLTSSTVTTTRDSEPASVRASSFTYYGAGDAKGDEYLLKTETVSAGSLATETTTYQYDSFGNKNRITTTASDTSQTRSVTQNFGWNGRYLQSTTNDLDQSSVINERDNYGNVKAATDLNDLQSKIFYDVMGSEYLRKDVTGAWSRVDTNFCGAITCPTGAKYRVYKRVAGGGKSYEYYDVLGRVIRSSKVGFDGALIHVDTEYDNLNRIKRQSVPFSGETAQYWTENTYDSLGRIVSITAPDGSVSTTNYEGNKTTFTNSLSQTRKEYRNGLGLLEKAEDHLGGIVEYEYDLYGNLAKTKTTADGTTVAVRICYDALGRKTAMHDPDKGGFLGNANLTCEQVSASPKKAGWWYYSYNGFGELTEQTDTKGQRVKNYYDELGRMVGRTDYLASGAIEGFSQWFYEGGVGTHNPSIKGKLTATIMNTATNLTTAQVETHIQNGTASCSENDISCHKTLFDFDILGQPITNTVYYPGGDTPYVSQTAYDSFGRVYLQYDALDHVIRDSSGRLLESGAQTHYNAYGYAYKITDIATGKTLQLTQEVNLLGQVTKTIRGNGLVSVNTYDIRTGLLTNQKTLNSLNLSTVQNNNYGWDTVGNLKYRQNLSGKPGTPVANNSSADTYGQVESFCYDGLNRLIKTNPSTTSTSACASLSLANQDIRYDGHGNIKYKKGVGDYVYAGGSLAGPHAVTQAGADNYSYDANGNNISGAGRALLYTSYDMVKTISKAGKTTEFKYGIDRSRWQRIDATASTIYMGNVERIQTSASTVEWKRNVAGVVLTYRTDGNNNLQSTDKRYIYTDHLGSVDLITDANGEVQGQFSKVSHAMSFDAWGARRNIAQWSDQAFAFSLSNLTVTGFTQPITRRGFTGHEMVDDMGIIHMNGRIYDPKLGRFLQADPFIQAATNTQSFNRYSYLLNNPLNATDPSGFFLKKLHDFGKNLGRSIIRGASKIFGADVVSIVGNVLSAFCGPAAPLCAAQWNYDFARAMGASSNMAFKSAASALVTGMVPGGVSVKGFLVRGVVGGISSVISDGKFGHGFLSAGISGMVGNTGNWYADLAIKMAVGGSVSELTGGKFANGARSAAISFVAQSGLEKITAGGKLPEPEPSSSGGTCSSPNPINIATGEKYLTMVDYQAEGSSQLKFERHYSSYASEKTSLGIGWRSNFDRNLEIRTVGGFTLKIIAVRHEGDPVTFNWVSDNSGEGGRWVANENRYETIRKTEAGWELLLTDNVREIYDADGRLIAVKHLDGYEQVLKYGDQSTVKNVLLSVADNFGQQLQFAYDLQARMVSMTATDGSVTYYEYDQNHNLTKVISPDETPNDKFDNAYVVYDYTDTRFTHAITSIRNSQGQRIHSMAYDDQGRAILSALGDDAERVDMVFSKGESNTKQTRVKNALGKITNYTFTVDNKPILIEGQPTATCIGSNQGYEYNEKGQLISKTDWNGAMTHYEYDERGLETLRIEAVGTAEERRVGTQWHSEWRLPVKVISPTLEVEFGYDAQGRLIKRTERDLTAEISGLLEQHAEREWRYKYNEKGLLAQIDGPRTDVKDISYFEYDAHGHRIAVVNALGHRSEVLAVNERGLPERVRDANGLVTEMDYNARGWLQSKTVKSELGDSTTYYYYSGVSDYNNNGLVSAVTLPNGDEITYEYDGARRLIAQQNKAGERLEYTLDLEGNRIAQRIYNATGNLAFSQSQVFDELSRLLQSIGADGAVTSFGYDKAGNRISVTDALGHKTAYAYDALNRLVATTDAMNGVVTNSYDEENRLTSVTDQRGLKTTYRYNGFGNKVAQISPDTGETRYAYNEAGNMVSKLDARGVLTEYHYDSIGRVTDIIYPAANEDNIHYDYDDKNATNAVGRVSKLNDASGTQSYSYNTFGQITQVQSSIKGTRYRQTYDYDRNGQLAAQQYPSGRRVNFYYDAQGRLSNIDTEYKNRDQTLLTKINHHPFGPLAALGYGNGVQLNVTVDKNYRIRTQKIDSALNDGVYDRAYDYNEIDNIVRITDYTTPAANQAFGYDELSRLTHASGSYGVINYQYDAVGNRKSLTQNNRFEDYTYADNSNRLLSVISESEQDGLRTRTLEYDAVGNIINDSSSVNKALTFGHNNRLEQVKVNGNEIALTGYEYNAKGQRVIKQANGKIIHFHYDTDNRLLAETTETGLPIREYIYAANQRIAMVDYQRNTVGDIYFMVNDHLGTPQLLLDAQQQIVWSVNQSPFGEVTITGDIEQPLRFPGQYADAETGYSYNYFRDYDSTLGRYIESDPIGLEAGVNTFGYVVGNPVNRFDLWGLDDSDIGYWTGLRGAGTFGAKGIARVGFALDAGSIRKSVLTGQRSIHQSAFIELDVLNASFSVGWERGRNIKPYGDVNMSRDLGNTPWDSKWGANLEGWSVREFGKFEAGLGLLIGGDVTLDFRDPLNSAKNGVTNWFSKNQNYCPIL
jgi:RHS repeat-associated protein